MQSMVATCTITSIVGDLLGPAPCVWAAPLEFKCSLCHMWNISLGAVPCEVVSSATHEAHPLLLLVVIHILSHPHV